MKIISRRRPKDPFASFSLGDLRKAEALLKCRIGTLESESQDIKGQIQNLLDDGASICDEPRDTRRAIRIQTLVEQYHMKDAVCVKLEHDLRLISYVIAMRDRDRVLNRSDACQKLSKISPDELEEWLAALSVHEGDDRHRTEEIHALLSEQVPDSKGHPVDETSIRLAMEKIRSGAIPVAVIIKNLLEEPLSGKERTRTTITQRDKFPDKQGRDEQ
jgi:hypothetical protein